MEYKTPKYDGWLLGHIFVWEFFDATETIPLKNSVHIHVYTYNSCSNVLCMEVKT